MLRRYKGDTLGVSGTGKIRAQLFSLRNKVLKGVERHGRIVPKQFFKKVVILCNASGFLIIYRLYALPDFFSCDFNGAVYFVCVFLCALGLQFGDITIPLFLYRYPSCLIVAILLQQFLQGVGLFFLFIGLILVFPAVNTGKGSVI